ncbi:MAG: GntR family transcriptional regulator [Planctomycetaceae bacterium]
MFLHIDPSNGLAIYDQIVRQIKFAVAGEAIQPGEMVPSVREMARELAVNPNTVSRVYRELQSENVLETVRGTGLEVTARAPERCRKDRIALIRERFRSVILDAAQSRLELSEIRALADEELTRLENKRSAR